MYLYAMQQFMGVDNMVLSGILSRLVILIFISPLKKIKQDYAIAIK